MPPPEPATAGLRPRRPALRATQPCGGPSQQVEGQGADPPDPQGSGPASRLASLAQPVVDEEEIDGPVAPVLARL